jgi:hypothetical protein
MGYFYFKKLSEIDINQAIRERKTKKTEYQAQWNPDISESQGGSESSPIHQLGVSCHPVPPAPFWIFGLHFGFSALATFIYGGIFF